MVMLLAFAAAAVFQYLERWTSLERFYLTTYLATWALPYKRADAYQGIFLIRGNSKWLATDADIQLTLKQPDGTWRAAIADADKASGWTQWSTSTATTDQIKSGPELHRFLAQHIFRDQSWWDLFSCQAYFAFAAGTMWLIFALPRDLKLKLEYEHGNRQRGTQLVSARQFNQLMGHPKGLGFLNLHQSLTDRIFFPHSSNCVRIPSDAEFRHALVLGDSGHGKSSTLRQILDQANQRGISCVVLDPAREYVKHYFNASRGDIVLNPLDDRCPFWMPGDEIDHPAEIDMLAESVFPIPDETPIDKRFFLTAARDVLGELLKLNPTPAQLYRWMCDEDEMIRLLRGTHVTSQIAEKSAGQRGGVFGTLTQAAKMFEFLPDDASRPHWSARQWAEQRQGWVFLTSLPMFRGRLRPLTTLWLEQLLLRVMNDDDENRRQTFFILDELDTLPRIEQLVHALFEARKARATIVIGLQGKAQQDVKYGKIAQAMVSMAATKILMASSEPDSARWSSEAIGEVEVKRYRESRTVSTGTGAQQTTVSIQAETTREPVIMASQIMGLPPLHAYFRHGNFVVPIRMPFIPAQKNHQGFIRRSLSTHVPPSPLPAPAPEGTEPPQISGLEQNPLQDQAQDHTQGYF